MIDLSPSELSINYNNYIHCLNKNWPLKQIATIQQKLVILSNV